MKILMTFPDPADSPNGRSPLRLRYSIQREDGRTTIVLRYSHGSRVLTREAWQGYRAAGAKIEATDARVQAILTEALGEWR